ncbi:MAG: hypothetical protein H6624_06845 [Bdellovibrionaceae bacterium]|nr:hypothetical protein [Bdellovibrionales bacterium]MCB9084043.1 hypothetical protein [Pseudobdellovibrionaceae bacterium]
MRMVKKLLVGSLVMVMLSPLAFARGGDIGGGGMARDMERAVRMAPQKINRLKQMATEDAAFSAWMNTLSPNERDQVMKIVFEYHILPQLEGR